MLEEVIARLDALVASWLEPPLMAASYSAHDEGREDGYNECARELRHYVEELRKKNSRDYLK